VNAGEDRELLDGLVGEADATMDADRVAKRRALEQCLGKLSVSLRSQLLMRCFLGLSYAEIGEVVGARHSTVQVRMSRILPRLRQCLRGEGLAR
jgi:RNA polymerase sigma factor (sigma-70 family)